MGRWPIDRRRLPDDEIAREIRDILKNGLQDSASKLPGGGLKEALLLLARGDVKANPFPDRDY